MVICLTLIHLMKFSFLLFRSIEDVCWTRKRRFSIVYGCGACNNNISFDQIICCMIYSCCIAVNSIAFHFKQKSCIKRTIINWSMIFLKIIFTCSSTSTIIFILFLSFLKYPASLFKYEANLVHVIQSLHYLIRNLFASII